MLFRNWKIKSRLIVLAVVPIAITSIFLVTLLNWNIDSLTTEQIEESRILLVEEKKRELKNIVDLAYRTVKDIYESGGSRAEAVELMKKMEFGEDGYLFGYDGESIRVFSGPSDAKIGESYKSFSDVNGVYLVNDLITAGKNNNFGKGDNFVTYHFPRLGKTEPSAKLSYAIFLERWNLMIGTGIYIDTIDEAVNQLKAQQEAASSRLLFIGLVINVVLVLGIIGFSLIIAKSILNPLSEVSDSIGRLANGNGDLTERVPVSDESETGLLSKRLNTFLDSLQTDMNRVVSVALNVNSETDGMVKGVEDLKEVTSDQVSAIHSLSELADQMSNVARDVYDSANSVSDANNDVKDFVDKALQTATKSRNEMGSLNTEISNASEIVSTVGDDVENIGAILQVIESIAEQTNLLALNAAIEAARAGEQGRGFAVVADEVRNLASKTQGSTEEIKNMIERLQSGSKSAVDAMEKSKDKTVNAENSVVATSDSLKQIASTMEVIQEKFDLIFTSSDKQNQLADDVNRKLNTIQSQTDSLSKVADINTNVSNVLKEKGQELGNVVKQFKLS